MPAPRLASLLLLTVAVPACTDDGSSQPPFVYDFGEASSNQTLRAVNAATGQDLELARWLVERIGSNPPPCVLVDGTSQPGVTRITAANGCVTEGLTITGTATVVSPNAFSDTSGWQRMDVDLALVNPNIEGSVVLHGNMTFTHAGGPLQIDAADLDVTRLRIKTSSHLVTGGPLSVAVDGLYDDQLMPVSYSGATTIITGADDELDYTTATNDCGTITSPRGSDQMCMWNNNDSVLFDVGPVNAVWDLCQGHGDDRVSVVTSQPGTVTLDAGDAHYAFTDPPLADSGNGYEYRSTVDPCGAEDPFWDTVGFDDGVTAHESSVFLGIPNVEYLR